MPRKLVIHPSCLPSRLPLPATAAIALVLDRLHAPGWVWGGCGVLVLIFWAVAIYGMATEAYAVPELKEEKE